MSETAALATAAARSLADTRDLAVSLAEVAVPDEA